MRFTAPRSHPGSTLAVSLISVFFAVTITALILNSATVAATGTIRARQLSDTRRATANYAEYVAAKIREALDKPEAPITPTTSTIRDILKTINDQPPSPADLGIDTETYSAQIAAVTCDNTTTINNQLLTNKLNPSRTNYPGLGTRSFLLMGSPYTVNVSLTLKNTGKTTAATALADFIHTKRTFLQYGTYYNGFNPQISSGMPGKIKGGIFSNNPIRIWTNDWGGLGYGAAIQIDFISGKTVQLGSGGNSYYNGIYISGGDLGAGGTTARMDGKITFFANSGSPYSAPANPYDAVTAKADFIPAFLTVADTGDTSSLSNYFKPTYSNAKNYLIDSRNANIKDLSSRFNGNLKDNNTGWEAVYPDVLPKSMQQLPAADLAAAGLVPTNPRAIIEPPREPDERDAARGPLAQQQEVENTKFANKSNFYVLIENPGTANTQPLPPVIFNSAQLAAKYKQASRGLTDAEKLTLRASSDFAPGIIVLPASAATAIEVKRSFYDKSQIRASGSDPVKSMRISAVDINMGGLREAIGTSASTTSLTMADGSAWNPTASGKGWNGIIYVDVADPKGASWVARNRAGWPSTPTELGYDTSAPITNPTIPAGYAYSGGRLIESASGAAATDPLDTGGEETLVAVRLYNAKKVPDLSGYAGYSGPGGCTLATNTAVYTVGHVNADGVRTTDKANNATDKQFADPAATSPEPNTTPFAIACDSLTAFSPAHYRTANDWYAPYDTSSTKLDGGDWCMRNPYETQPQASGFTDKFQELNFSLISGGTDTSLKGSYGNGSLMPAFVLNIPCGQNRNGLDTRFRGSRNLLFASKYNRKYFNGYPASYEATNDDAYDIALRESLANVPPGMPFQRDYALINLRYQ